MDTPARHTYTGDGTTRGFRVPTKIIGDDYVRIELNGTYVSDRSIWDIVNNTVLFIDAPASGVIVDIQIATSQEALALLGSVTNVDIVATNIDNVNAAGTNIANVNTVAGSIANVNTSAVNIANINTVATNIIDVNTVAADIAHVIRVSQDLAETISEIETVANDLNETTSEIETVSNSIANVNTVGLAISNVNTVASSIAKVNTVSDSITNVTTVSNSIDNVNTVSTNITKVSTVSTSIDNVNNVSTNITDINSVATTIVPNISEILLADTNAATATTKATEASNSATNAATSAANALSYKNTAGISAAAAISSEADANNAAGNAANSAANALEYAEIASQKAEEIEGYVIPGGASYSISQIDDKLEVVESEHTIQEIKLTNFLSDIELGIIPLISLSSPVLTGTPTAPTQAVGDNSTKIATTAFVTNRLTSEVLFCAANRGLGWETLSANQKYGFAGAFTSNVGGFTIVSGSGSLVTGNYIRIPKTGLYSVQTKCYFGGSTGQRVYTQILRGVTDYSLHFVQSKDGGEVIEHSSFNQLIEGDLIYFYIWTSSDANLFSANQHSEIQLAYLGAI